MDAAARRRLLAWYSRARRDLPWRRTRDPYAILVSEVMLQQTRVETVVPYFGRWMARFPTLQALAAASDEAVHEAWAGLGYYRRARSLHAAAREAVAQHGGRLPTTAATLRELPGIGAYTAGAVASIAFGERVPCVDGNVARVAARLEGIAEPDGPALRRRVEGLAASWVPAGAAGDWNQAVMELGATLCTPRNPRCDDCPVAAVCVARKMGNQAEIPAPRKSKPSPVEARHFALVEQDGKLLLVRNPDAGLLAGMWMLPGGPADTPLARLVREQAGVRIRTGATITSARHLFSHRTWKMELRTAAVLAVEHEQPERETWWCPRARLATAALPKAMRLLLEADGKP